MSLIMIAFYMLLGSVVRYFGPKPFSLMVKIVQNEKLQTIEEKKYVFGCILKIFQSFWLIVGGIAILFNLAPLVYFIIGMYLTYIFKTLPEIQKEIEFLDYVNAQIEDMIQKLILEQKKEENEKA